VCITSKDGYSFMVKRKVANISGTLRNMLDADSEPFPLPPSSPLNAITQAASQKP
jgi:hypothetical protein